MSLVRGSRDGSGTTLTGITAQAGAYWSLPSAGDNVDPEWVAVPYLPVAAVFGFVPLPAPWVLAMIALTLGYVVAAEAAKRYFYARH